MSKNRKLSTRLAQAVERANDLKALYGQRNPDGMLSLKLGSDRKRLEARAVALGLTLTAYCKAVLLDSLDGGT